MKKKSDQKKSDPSAVVVEASSEAEIEAATARTLLRTTVQAGLAIKDRHRTEDSITVTALTNELNAGLKKVEQGDLSKVEAMLFCQAHTLETIFTEMLQRARNNMGQYPQTVERYMRLAMKAQSQCRTTIEALAEIKNPAPYIQNNRAQYQQVNNGQAVPAGDNGSNTHAHAGKNQKTTNGLLTDGRADYETVDFGGTGASSGDDTELEAVGAIHRAEDGGR